MGEIAEMMLDGILYAGCGEAIITDEDTEPAGFPQYCSEACAANCGVELADDEVFSLPPPGTSAARVSQLNEPSRNAGPRKHHCPFCNKGFRTPPAMAQHIMDKHK